MRQLYDCMQNKQIRERITDGNVSLSNQRRSIRNSLRIRFCPRMRFPITERPSKEIRRFLYWRAVLKEIYERFVFDRRDQENDSVIDQYATSLWKLSRTRNFYNCLFDSLIRVRLVLGINATLSVRNFYKKKR